MPRSVRSLPAATDHVALLLVVDVCSLTLELVATMFVVFVSQRLSRNVAISLVADLLTSLTFHSFKHPRSRLHPSSIARMQTATSISASSSQQRAQDRLGCST